jgi:hypothetical protein
LYREYEKIDCKVQISRGVVNPVSDIDFKIIHFFTTSFRHIFYECVFFIVKI